MVAVAKLSELGPEEVRALRGSLSRADFARKIGVTPLTVYRWELPDEAPESRRPRGAVAERLRRALATNEENTLRPPAVALVPSAPPPAGPIISEALDPDDAAHVLPVVDRILAADFARAEDHLMHLLVAGELRGAAGRAMAQAALALCQLLARNDARSAFATRPPALKEADVGLLPPPSELLVRVAASLCFSSPDGRLFDVGRVNAQVARGERLATRDTPPDLVFLLRVGAAAATLYAGGAGHSAAKHARAALEELMDSVSEPVTRLLADELRTHFLMLTGHTALVVRRFEEVADRAAKIGVPIIEARARSFIALRLTDEVAATDKILEVSQKARDIASAARLGPGLHSIFIAKTAGEALLRLARFTEAEQALESGVAAAMQMSWAPLPIVIAFVRLFDYTGRRDRLLRLGEEMQRIPSPIPKALGEFLIAAHAAQESDPSERLGRAELAVEKSDPSPYLLTEVLLYGVGLRLAHADVSEIKLAVRRVQRRLDRYPSATLTAQLKRYLALLACREGKLTEAAPLLEASIATFTLVGDRPEVALGRHWLAKVAYELEEPGSEAKIAESEAELRELGLVPFPSALPFGTFDPTAPASISTASRHLGARAEGVTVALERLSVRGTSPALLRRELATVVSELHPNRGVIIEEIGPQGDARTIEERGDVTQTPPDTWFEFGDGMGGRFRFGLCGTLPDGAYELLSMLGIVTSLSLEVASLRGLAEESSEAPSTESNNAEVPGFVAVSPSMRRLRAEIGRLGKSRATVILQGESGTGKEVIAKAIHDLSQRASGPYITFNCAAVPRDLFEGQLFGYRRGAFTGALSDHPGVIRVAHGGTLFLDEIGELPLELQAKLLRFLENREILPLGEAKSIEVDVRTIAATHQDLQQRVREGRFREDLFYRLQVVPLTIAPLRERPEDIAALARHFVRMLTPSDAETPVLAPDAIARLAQHSWPGNVRELRNVIERTLAFSPLPRVLTASHLRLEMPSLRPR